MHECGPFIYFLCSIGQVLDQRRGVRGHQHWNLDLTGIYERKYMNLPGFKERPDLS